MIRSEVVPRAALVIAVVAACGGSPPPPTAVVAPGPPEPGPQAKQAAEAISRAYELLTLESAVPGDPAALRDAAVEALAPRGWKARPIAWTNDPRKDVEVLKTAVLALALRGELPADAVLRAARAMTVAVSDTQTFALARPSVQALFAMIAGVPVVQPGIVAHRLDDGRWAVSDVLPGGAAAAGGVGRGDILVSIDGAPIVHGWVDLVPFVGVPAGTKAELVIERDGKNRTVVLALQPVASPIVDWKMLPGGAGYIRLWTCTHTDDDAHDAGKLFAIALGELDKKHAKKLVLDLRGNPGGYPFEVASLLVEDDPLMVAVSGGAEQPVARAKVAAWKTKRPTAVLVDEGTASGAEMIAFALRDLAGATIVGRPTAGGLSFPTTEKLSGDVTISYPLSRVGSAKTRTVLDGNRLVPDVVAPNPTLDDYAAGRDPQVDAALTAMH